MVQETTSNGTDPLNDPAIGAKSFGFKNVSEDDKQEMVDEVFHSVARKYDIMNDMMSAGMHRLWKEALVSAINPPKSGAAYRHLDVAGGTGDIAFQVVERSNKHVQSTVFDINGSMLAVGAERAEKRKLSDNVEFVEGNAEELPFEDKSFDVYTVAFGIRNVPRRDKALSEAYRVLKRGGRLFVLEFAPVDMPFFNKVYETYSFNVIPEIGRMITGDAESYRYLVESIAKFPPPKRFEKLIEAAGFENVTHRLYTAGIACLHSGWKL